MAIAAPKEEEKKEIIEPPQNPNNKMKLNFSVNRDILIKPAERESKYTIDEVSFIILYDFHHYFI